MIRQSLKSAVEAIVVHSGTAAIARRVAGADRLILAYHNVIPDDAPICGDRSLHLLRRAFADQLECLVRSHDVVPLDALLDARGGTGRPRAAITFDDAYRGAVVLAAEELARRGLPATFFVCPALLGEYGFWWDEVVEADGSGIADDRRTFFLDELRGQDAVIRAWAAEHGLRQVRAPDHLRSATEAELAAAARIPGMTVAPHSWSHPNLARLPTAELQEEITRPAAWLRERFPNTIAWLSYPYGRSSPEVERAAEAAGYVAAVRVEGGPIRPRGAPRHGLPRVNVPSGISTNGFAIRLAGLRD